MAPTFLIWQVLHRDIKPGNILLDRAGGARLADLGLAFADDDPLLTTADGTLGTPHYISPEQARDPTTADIRSDIWSLGATLFHTLCGRPPFAGASTAEVLSGVLYAAIPDPNSLEPELSRGLVLVLRGPYGVRHSGVLRRLLAARTDPLPPAQLRR